MDLSRVVREPAPEMGWVYVYVSDPFEGCKPLGYIREHGGLWEATPVQNAGWVPVAELHSEREAIVYLSGLRFGRVAPVSLSCDFVPVSGWRTYGHR